MQLYGYARPVITVLSSRYANGRTPIEILTGETPDIKEYLDFGLYYWISFKQNTGLGTPEIDRWLGVSHCIEQLMSYWLLSILGISISCTTMQLLTHIE